MLPLELETSHGTPETPWKLVVIAEHAPIVGWAFAGELQKPRETSANERKKKAFLSVM